MSRAKTFLCRCEDVTCGEFREAYREGFTELESLKRYTGVGTGFCQGKGCLSEAAEELARLRDVPPEQIGITTIRPPAEPLTFAQLAALPVPAAADATATEPRPTEPDPTRPAADGIDPTDPAAADDREDLA